ncbi:MAG: hypothetical protein J1E57_07065 [Prevotella sp.]|nr:hypothetical protein [Prevotella sp.]
MKKITPRQYTSLFFAVVALLAIVRWMLLRPSESVAANGSLEMQTDTIAAITATIYDGNKHPIYSVPDFKNTFPDVQDVQIEAALKYGVKSVANREDAEKRKKELVYIGANPYFHVDRLNNSIPYLVPRASLLVQDIGRAFFDSLYAKHIPMHKIILTSILRTEEDVRKLRTRNGNATENSCHLYGTTVDICYNRYMTVGDPDEPARRQVQNDTLKWVLSEVLRDFRNQQRCWVKYEVKQGCFHITVN